MRQFVVFVNMLPRGSPDSDTFLRSRRGGSVDAASNSASENGVFLRNKTGSANIWRPSSLVNLVNPMKKRGSAVFDSSPVSPTSPSPIVPAQIIENESDTANKISENSLALNKVEKSEKSGGKRSLVRKTSGCWGTSVSIVLVEAKGLPNSPTDGMPHGLYCKLRLGAQSLKSKTVQNLLQPEWRERFKFHLYKDHQLKVTLWDKGKRKNFMGGAVLDLSQLEKERTHEIWQQLDDGYGVVHLSITICTIKKRKEVNIDETEEVQLENKNALFNPTSNWKLVGQLYVKVISAKGFSGRPSAYCSLEVDNEMVRTHSVRGSPDPTWNKNFVFNVYDVMSTLDLKVYDSSLMTALNNESLGRISIPLLRIRNGEMKWYALKDRSNRGCARGNCPRVLLEMSLFWNPIKASLRVFRPREVKYIKKSQKFDLALVYKNLEFTRDVFISLIMLNEMYKHLFEWESQELSFAALIGWLLFWYHFKLWATPLLLLAPFVYFWIFDRNHQKWYKRGYGIVETPDNESKEILDNVPKTDRPMSNRILDLPEMTTIITSGVDYLGALAEKLYNLASFKVPFLSYIAIILLIIASAAFYLIPFNYLMMMFGIYKFSRNYLRSERILNNDLEDFIARIPDTEVLNDWKELNVPEPAPSPVNGINISSRPYTLKGSIMY